MRKRGQGEGSIYKRADGRWVAVVSLGYKNGKRHRKSVYAETRRDVQEKLNALLFEHNRGLPIATGRQTVGQYLSTWLKHSVQPSVRPKTHHSYSQMVRLHIEPDLGRIQLSKLSPARIEQFLNEKLEDGLSPRSVQYLHAILRRALQRAVKWNLIARNPAKLIDPPRVSRPEVRPFSPEEAQGLLDAVRGDRLEALYSVALALGLRQSESLGLRWGDIDLDAGNVRVCVTLERLHGEFNLVEPKSERSKRVIATPDFAVTALRAHRARQLEERLIAGSRWKDHGLVFTTRVGTPIHPRNLVRHFHGVLKRAGLPRKRFHDLRHTCASLLLAQGIQPRVVMEILGHSQISLTMDTYSHVIPSLKRDAAESMEQAFGKRS